MGAMPTLPMSRPLTLEDFEAIRDVQDGHRYELIDGTLVVTPSPRPQHQDLVPRLWQVLETARPAEYRVYVAPLDVRLAHDTLVQPDLVVVRAGDVGAERIDGLPVLAVEVLSPSTRTIDLGTKLLRYQQAGIAHYWVVDPEALTITVWTLRDGAYAVQAAAGPDEEVSLAAPWPVSFTLSALVTDR